MHSVEITGINDDLKRLSRQWLRPAFSADNGIAPLDSLHQAGDAILAVAGFFDDVLVTVGSGVMVGPGVAFTATHVLDEFPKDGPGPVLLSFLPNGRARAWLPTATVVCSGRSNLGLFEERTFVSDLSVVSCSLNSDALVDSPLSLAPVELCMPRVGERLWAIGFRDALTEGHPSGSPFVSSGLVSACYPYGRGERMASPCIEVDMEALGGMSGGPVLNADGRVIGIVTSSFENGPTYVTLVWDSMRLSIAGLPRDVWGRERSGLAEGIEANLVRIKGNFQVDAKRNVTLILTDDEIAIFRSRKPTHPHS